MQRRYLDRNDFGNEDWYGNNAAFKCPECEKIFIVTSFLNPKGRPCPHCEKSFAYCTGSPRNKKSEAYIEYPNKSN